MVCRARRAVAGVLHGAAAAASLCDRDALRALEPNMLRGLFERHARLTRRAERLQDAVGVEGGEGAPPEVCVRLVDEDRTARRRVRRRERRAVALLLNGCGEL
eukprot:27435-Prymnesium_polylepis.1